MPNRIRNKLVVLPIEPELLKLLTTTSVISAAINKYSNGIKGLADLTFDYLEYEEEANQYVQEVCDDIFVNLDAYDENPAIDLYNHETVERVVMSDAFLCFLSLFYEHQQKLYKELLGDFKYTHYEHVLCRSRSSNAYRLYF